MLWKPRSRSSSESALLSSVAIMATAVSASPMVGNTSASQRSVPSSRMARQRRSPSTSRYLPPSGTTTTGETGWPPVARIEAARAAMSPKSLRGLPPLATTSPTAISFLRLFMPCLPLSSSGATSPR